MLQISTCSDLTSGSCELTADGVGAVQGLTELSDTSYQVDVQVCVSALCPYPVATFTVSSCRYVSCVALII